MPVRTSLTHPLSIVALSVGKGLLGITQCPGMTCPIAGESKISWARDMDDDLDIIAMWGAKAVMTLLMPEEMDALGVGSPDPEIGLSPLGRGVLARRMDWGHIALAPGAVPGEGETAALAQIFDAVLPKLRAGERMLIHCDTGGARSGSVAAFALTRSGLLPEQAIARVRSMCGPSAIETCEQHRFVARGWV